mmetsp:Transcript_13925/g.21076  ORF Transcript_13925/g.21076 Transcript_13925/m.21076 type:complete len:103 (+) Transcript_13925:54-362(+)
MNHHDKIPENIAQRLAAERRQEYFKNLHKEHERKEIRALWEQGRGKKRIITKADLMRATENTKDEEALYIRSEKLRRKLEAEQKYYIKELHKRGYTYEVQHA